MAVSRDMHYAFERITYQDHIQLEILKSNCKFNLKVHLSTVQSDDDNKFRPPCPIRLVVTYVREGSTHYGCNYLCATAKSFSQH